MKLRYINVFTVALMLLLSACAAPRMFTTIDVLRPAEVSFAPAAERLLLVDNSVVQPYNRGHHDYRTYNEYERPAEVSLRFDSAALFCLAGVRESFDGKGFFKTVDIADENSNTTGLYDKVVPLKAEKVNELAARYKTQAIFILDNLYIQDERLYTGNNSYGAIDVQVQTKWSVRYPNSSHTDTVSFVDVFSWENNRAKDLPERYDALVDASILAGYNIADRLMPRWEEQDRYLYVNEKKQFMKEGMEAFTRREWKEAIAHWDEAEKQNNTKIKYKAANNKAIAYEILGDYDNALLNMSKALEHYANSSFFFYNEEETENLVDTWKFLRNREAELQLIKNQLGE